MKVIQYNDRVTNTNNSIYAYNFEDIENYSTGRSHDIETKFATDKSEISTCKSTNLIINHYDIDFSECDLKSYLASKEQFLLGKTKEQGLTKEDSYSLLLNCSVVLGNEKAIETIFEDIKNLASVGKRQILTSVDDTDHSPLSSALESDHPKIFDLFKQFIEANLVDTTEKISLPANEVDKENLLSAIEFPQICNTSPHTYLDNFLKPIYEEGSLQDMIGLVEQMETDF
jgi:hypothetical protein